MRNFLHKIRFLVSVFTISILCFPAIASAHVVVTPSQAKIADEQLFSMSSPNEEQTSITKVVLEIPNGVTNVIPTSKANWQIIIGYRDKTHDVAILTWEGGQIPVGQRDDFTFSAQLPGKETTVIWKAYQTYADGTTVHWDQEPKGSDDSTGNAGPYSKTLVLNDLGSVGTSSNQNSTLAISFSVLASLLALTAIMRSFAKKK